MIRGSIRDTLNMLVLLAVVASAGGVFLAWTPAIKRVVIPVRVGQHAIDRHAKDALLSRLAVFNCDPVHLQVLVHDPIIDNPASRGKWMFVCPNTASTLCAGMVAGAVPLPDGVYPEITAFVSTCQYWLSTVPLRDGYTKAEIVAVGKALGVLIAMQEVEQ